MHLTIVQKKIFDIRGHRVMLDVHLAELYKVETKHLKRQVKRNIDRFPEEFMFELSKQEYEVLRRQIGTSNKGRGGSRYLPYAFTEHGIAQLSTVLKSKKAIQMNIGIIKVFISLKQFALNYKELQKKIEQLEKKYDKNFEEIYQALNLLLNPPQPKRKKVGYKHYDE